MPSKISEPTHAFTLIELIVAITIIAVLTTLGTLVYTNSMASGRDSKRKADLDQIRNALELYRSNSGTSLYPTTIATITEYIKIPVESKNRKDYGYEYVTGGNDYTLGAVLERFTGPTCAVVPTICWTLDSANPTPARCNYCVGPYGTK